MNTSKIAAFILGLTISALWPVSTQTVLADDTHAVEADDHAHAKSAAAPAAPASEHDDDAHATKSTGKPAEPKHQESKPDKPVPVSPATSRAGESKSARPATRIDTSPSESSSHSAKPTPTTKPAAKPLTKSEAKSETKSADPAEALSDTPDAAAALRMITEGNSRWATGSPISPNTDSSRRNRLADEGQKPFVTVLTCADSRVPVERVFDRGVGDVFVVRVAGNIAGASETATIEYGVGHLKTPLLVVMGHTKCGAVAAASTNAEVHGHVAELIQSITPAVERAKRNNPSAEGAELTSVAVRENVWQSVFDLIKSSDAIRAKIGAGELKVIGAVYDVASGKVDFMGEHPWQAELVEAMNARAAAKTATAGADDKHE